MTHSDRPRDEPDDQSLLRLLREAARQQGESSSVPSDEAVEACLLGHATIQQREEVVAALENSPEFRRLYLHLSRELESFHVAAGDDRDLPSGPVPSRTAFLGERIKGASRHSALRFLWPSAAVLVAVAGTSMWWAGRESATQDDSRTLSAWRLEVRDVDPGLLIKDAPRGGSAADSVTAFPTSQTAAMAALSRCLRFDGTRITTDTSALQLPPALPGPGTRAVFILSMGNDHMLQASVTRPKISLRGSPVINGWALALPSRDLYSLKVVTDTTYAAWPADSDSILILVVSVADSAGYLPGWPHMVHR